MTTPESEDEITPAVREARLRALKRLIELFRDHDVEAELRRLKEEDEGF